MKERLAEVGLACPPPLLREAAVLGLVDGDKMGGEPSFLLLLLDLLELSPWGLLGDTPYLGDGEVLYLGEALADFADDEGLLTDLLSGGPLGPVSVLVRLGI